MKYDIVLAGIGGQGILSIAGVLSLAAAKKGFFFKQSEVHGMSQRGGAVYAHFRLADGKIYSDLIPHGRGDLILSAEPLEALRYLEFLHPEKGKIVSNSHPEKNIPDYPDLGSLHRELLERGALLIDGFFLARKFSTPRAQNIAVLGAASRYLPLESAELLDGIAELFQRKGAQVVEKNQIAFKVGARAAQLFNSLGAEKYAKIEKYADFSHNSEEYFELLLSVLSDEKNSEKLLSSLEGKAPLKYTIPLETLQSF